MRTVSEIEAASLATWPALETIEDGQWRARFARGFSGRSNAIWSLDPADDTNAAQRIETLSARYAEHDLPTVFRVTPLTGGGILDVGCYPVSMARLIAGAANGKPFLEPETVSGVAHLGQSGVDEWAAAVLKFPGGILAEVSCSVSLAQDNVLRILGTEGRIEVRDF